jgi:acyl transferase domain-containing protein
MIKNIFSVDHPKLRRFAGRVPNVSKFDVSFFRINYKQAHIMDLQCRLLLERACKAIVDAGSLQVDVHSMLYMGCLLFVHHCCFTQSTLL